MDESDIFGDDDSLDFDVGGKSTAAKKPAAKATMGANKKPAAAARKGDKGGEWPEDNEPKAMSAQERIAAMKARLAGIRDEDEPKKPTPGPKPSGAAVMGKKGGGGAATAAPKQALVRFSEAPGDDEELYFEDDEYDLPPAKKGGPAKSAAGGARPPPPSGTPAVGTGGAKKVPGLEDSDDEDVPEVDTRIRSTMALEKHWSEVEEKRKREEAQRKRKLKEKQAERQNEEQRLLLEIQEKKRREEEMRKRLLEEDGRRAVEDWKKKEDEKRKKFDAKIKAKDLQLQRLEEARKKREDQKKKLADEEERRRREYEAEMTRLTSEENDLIKKIGEEEESKRQAIVEEERRRVEDSEQRQKAEEDRKRKEAEEEMRLLEEEEKELLKREHEIERELEEKRRMREEKLREIQSALQSSQSKKDEAERANAPDPDEMLQFCLQVNASARRIKGTVFHGVFAGSQAVDVLIQWANNRRDALRTGQKYLDAGLFWPVEGAMALDDSDRLYNLEDANQIVMQARQELEDEGGAAAAAVAEPVAPVSQPPPKKAAEAAKQKPVPSPSSASAAPAAARQAASGPVGELRVLDDAGQQLPKYEFLLSLGETEIGRRSDNAISLPVLSVSKKHAKIECLGDGRFIVTDLGSSNKTRLFSTSSVATPVVLRPNEPYTVSSGAELLFGEIRCMLTSLQGGDPEYEYVYDQDDDAAPSAAAAAPPAAKSSAAPKKELPVVTSLDRFSVAPPMDAAPLPPGSSAPLPPRSVVGPKRTVRK